MDCAGNKGQSRRQMGEAGFRLASGVGGSGIELLVLPPRSLAGVSIRQTNCSQTQDHETDLEDCD